MFVFVSQSSPNFFSIIFFIQCAYRTNVYALTAQGAVDIIQGMTESRSNGSIEATADTAQYANALNFFTYSFATTAVYAFVSITNDSYATIVNCKSALFAGEAVFTDTHLLSQILQFAASATTGEDFSGDQTKFADVCSGKVADAQAYFEAAKKELGEDEFEFTMIYGNNEGDEVTKVAQAIKEQVEANLPGVVLNLQAMSKAERLDKMQNDNYDVALTRWGPDYADPMTYLGMWITNNSNKYGFWTNAEYDQIIADCTTGAYISDYDARWAALYDAEKLVLEEAVIAPLYTKANANLIADGVEKIDFHPVALNRVYKTTVKAAD